LRNGTLKLSCADATFAREQRAREGALLCAARRGEGSLHVSALAGDVLSLGAFHREPRGPMPPDRWRRRTGGRAVASGSGFRLITLALPHRAAGEAEERARAGAESLRPRSARRAAGRSTRSIQDSTR
jgi:hypothetical protein